MIWIIIPTLNEERALPQTLSALFNQAGPYQIVIVDGGSTDSTQDIACQFPNILWLRAPRGRAPQMNAGAAYVRTQASSSSDWLLFLHADTQLPPDGLAQLRELAFNHSCQAGGFLHRFSGDDWRLRMISWLDNVRCRHSRVIYGDQALFVRQELFHRVNGFPEQSMLEDVALSERLLAHTQPVLLAPPVVTDSRKFIQMGVWSSFLRVCLIILHVEFGLPTLTPSFFQPIR